MSGEEQTVCIVVSQCGDYTVFMIRCQRDGRKKLQEVKPSTYHHPELSSSSTIIILNYYHPRLSSSSNEPSSC